MGTLINYKNIAVDGDFHRALFDAEMTAELWLVMLSDIRARFGLDNIPFSLIKRLAKTPKAQVIKLLRNYADRL